MANAIRHFRNWFTRGECHGYSNSIYPSDIIVASPPEIGYYFPLFHGGFNGRDIAQMVIMPLLMSAHIVAPRIARQRGINTIL